MTLVVLAISKDEKELTCISDSRISNPPNLGTVLSDATAKIIPFTGLCCTKVLRDSLFESSVVAGWHEQLVPHEVQDQELAFVQ